MEAVTYAMSLKAAQLLKSSMLCIFPVGKWICLEHAHDWCVQVEANKREKRSSLTGASSTSTSPTRTRRLSLVVEPPKPIWEQERDDARRLHNFICVRIGAPMPDKKKDRTEESGGFTPLPLVSLEEKIDTLHNYLQATAAFTARTGHGGVAMLKYRQVKRFGSIMRSRISGAQPHGSSNSSGNTNSPSPRSSFSHVIPVYPEKLYDNKIGRMASTLTTNSNAPQPLQSNSQPTDNKPTHASAHETRMSLSQAYARNAEAKIEFLGAKLEEEKRQWNEKQAVLRQQNLDELQEKRSARKQALLIELIRQNKSAEDIEVFMKMVE
ncbi:hypothetical protein ON010_g5175 [Phytophthora cinnamomi]|nr:hypothetical protein ON010_g5175 [Phytophthora cinnamomi]